MKWAALITGAVLAAIVYYGFIGVPAWDECRAGGGSWRVCVRHLVR